MPDTNNKTTGPGLRTISDELMRLPSWARTFLCVALLLCTAFLCFVANRSEPAAPFWDENYHMTSAQRYLEGVAHFEPHPPLGLMLIAAGEALSDGNRGVDKRVLVRDKRIDGDNIPKGFSFAGMRLMPSLFAAAGALLFFGLMRELTGHRLHALLLSTLYLCENAFVVHLRAIHLDAFQLFFFLAALWLFVCCWLGPGKTHWTRYGMLGVLCGLALMVKLNSVALLALFPILWFRDIRRRHAHDAQPWFVDLAARSAVAILAVLAVTYATFYLHVLNSRHLPDANTSAAQQDLQNMSPAYRSFLEGHSSVTPGIVWVVMRDYFRFMDKDHKGVPKLDVTKPGENGSHPLHWILHDKAINYRWDSADGRTSYVQLVGNQLSWGLGLIALVLSLLLIVNHRVFAMPLRGTPGTYQLIEALWGVYAAFMLVHLWIGARRVMYLYHYFPGLVISYVLLVLMWRYLCEQYNWSARLRLRLAAGAAAAIVASFLLFVPLSNHWPLTREQCERRNVFATIVECR